MNEIAVFLGERDNISSFEESKYVKIFTREKFIWKVKKIILINRTSSKRVMNEIRTEYRNILQEMDECKIIVVKRAFGIPYSVFYMEDFSIWELEGNPLKYLDEIIASETMEEKKLEQAVEVAKKIEEGYYLVDLQELELVNPEISSKKAIIPYLEKEEVKKIEVLCCHVPPWLVDRKDKYNITLEIHEIKRNDYKVIIEKNN